MDIMDEESQLQTRSNAESRGAENRESSDRGQTERKRGNWRGRGRGRGYSNQRGSARKYYDQHDNRGGGDGDDRHDDGQRQDVRQKQTRSWNSRSNQDTNWRDSSSNTKEENWDSDISSRRKQRHPDRQIYSSRDRHPQDQENSRYDQGRQRRTDNNRSGRGDSRVSNEKKEEDWDKEVQRASDKKNLAKKSDSKSYKDRSQRRGNNSRSVQEVSKNEGKASGSDWDNEDDNKSEQKNQSKKNDIPYQGESGQRRNDNKSGFRGGRGNFRGRGGRGRNQDSTDDGTRDSQFQGRKGSRFNYDSRNKTGDRIPQSTTNEEIWGEEEKVSKPKRIIKREKINKTDKSASQTTKEQLDGNSKDNASDKKKQFVLNAEVAPFVPGLRASPTMGIDQNQHTSKDNYDDDAAYGKNFVGASAFGVYADPYGNYGIESNVDGGAAAEVSIGRGSRWNEWYHTMWTGSGSMEPNMHGRGPVSIMSRPGRGNIQNRQGRKRGQAYPYDTDKADNEQSQARLLSDLQTQPGFVPSDLKTQPGFVRKREEKPKSKAVKKSKSAGKQFSGSSETQTGTLIETLTDGTYECMVCCDVVKCEARVWSCSSCYTVFHLKCIKEWAKSPAAAAEESDGWKCPACRFITIHIPYVYRCFCGKTRDPDWEPGDTPHSCGEVCKRKRPNDNCNHPCNILCHPGPCPQCPANVKRSCVCGKTKQTVRCGAVPVLRCQKACGKMLNCAMHLCEQICHDGACDDCPLKIEQGCYCGKENREIVCSSSPDEVEGPEQYSCGGECEKELACGNHKCKDPCHSGDCDPCPFTPETVKHCPCGQTPLEKLLDLEGGKERTECTDPIPTCQKICGKPLLCGGDNVHTCQRTCHEGECGPCPGISMVRCRCGHRYIDIPCAEISKGSGEHICDRKCTKRKSCGKHKCQQKCCVDAGHECLQVCGRKLNCGVHVCEQQCHPGSCVRCLEASFEELYCHCGAAVLMPPVPCGTKPPECTQQCVRRHKCDHPVRHTCHSEEECPPCAELSTKMCMGGHEKRHNLPCYIDDVSCGNPCGRPLPCRRHTCQKTCHRGYCGAECSQPCPIPRPDCGHPCSAPCHPDTPCPKLRCKAKVTIKCGCGHLSETTQCLQGVDDTQLTEAFQKMTTNAIASQLKFGQASMDMTKLLAFRDDKGQRILECTEECARLERNRRWADALNIHDPDLLGNSAPSYIPFLKEQAKKNPAFVAAVEKDFATVVKAVQSKYTSRSHAFAPMNQLQRRTIHELSDFYGLESQSYDQEPKRNVVVTARRNVCHMPSVTLTAVVQKEMHPKAPMPIPLNSRYEDLRAASKAAKHSTTVLERKESKEDVIDYFEMT